MSRPGRAQVYPSRPVRIIVGFAPGGGVDIMARLIGQSLSEQLGQQFVVENRTGAGSNIGTEAVVRAPADGYSLLLASSANAINATLNDKLNYNFIRDTAPVAHLVRTPSVMAVNPCFRPKRFLRFIAYAKANPGKVNMASSGNGTALHHLSGELFKMMTGIDMVHVPYRGAAPALTDLIGGQVQILFADMSSIEYIKAGKLRALAVTTAQRSDVLPDIPTVGEFLPGFEAGPWYDIVAPKNTSAEIIDKLNHEINAVLVAPRMKARLAGLGATALPGSPGDFGKLIAEDTAKWAKVVKFAGIKAE